MKILIVRFSSIGDIVLTSPVVRCLKEQMPNVELHYLTKNKFSDLLVSNTNLDKVWTIEKDLNEVIDQLQKEKFDCIIDLHHNLRTLQLKRKLRVKSFSFNKLNLKKWWLVRFKKNLLPEVHVVDRYMDTLKHFKISNDGKGLELFLSEKDLRKVQELDLPKKYIAFAIGAQFETKVLPVQKMIDLLQQVKEPVVLLGGPTDVARAEAITVALSEGNVISLAGKITLMESAAVLKNASLLISHDTGLMHIGAAFKIPTVSIWGNTVPELGMYPYLKKEKFSIHQVENLSCRPCSKIGYQKCPKTHFACMNEQNTHAIAKDVNDRWQDLTPGI